MDNTLWGMRFGSSLAKDPMEKIAYVATKSKTTQDKTQVPVQEQFRFDQF